VYAPAQVLIREDKEDYVDCEFDETSLDGDTPLLWEVRAQRYYDYHVRSNANFSEPFAS
jgi:hypothetical protein